MMEQLIALKDKILEFWNKYTSKQKTIIICVACAILVAIVLLAYFMTRPVYTDVATLSGETATTFDTALQGAGLDYVKESDNNGNTTFKVEQSQYSDAVLLMGENQITVNERQVYLVLNAGTKYSDLQKIASVYSVLTDFSLIFTKLDETSSAGIMLNMRVKTNCPLSYVTWGQNVPEDIGEMDPQRVAKKLLSDNHTN